MKEINLSFTVEETNILLEALGQMPYKMVYGLIGNIQQQAAHQLENQDGRGPELAGES